ncbi:hypothetical protein GCM10028809_14480 [Spirosoma gilvum]
MGMHTAWGQKSITTSAKSDWASVRKPVVAAPVIAWQNPLAEQVVQKTPGYRITLCVQSAEPITQVQILRNGIALNASQRGFKRVSCGQEISETIQLSTGSNELRAVVTNAGGTTTSESRLITYQPEAAIVHKDPSAQKRLALIIANAAYPKYPLKNPLNDGVALKEQLENLGFVVTSKENLPLRKLKETVDTFMTSLPDNAVSLVYYAGHGLMINGENYLQPVDADPSSESDVEYECYSLRRLIARMEHTNPKGTNLVFWDACRNNPYRSWRRGAGELVFVQMQPAVGTLVVYATEPGKPSHDGDQQNSLFASELIRHINQPGVDIYDLVDRIDQGIEARGYKQPPYVEGRLRGRFYFKPAQ